MWEKRSCGQVILLFDHSKDMWEERSCGQVILSFDHSKDMWEERSCGQVILWFDHSKNMWEVGSRHKSADSQRYSCFLRLKILYFKLIR